MRNLFPPDPHTDARVAGWHRYITDPFDNLIESSFFEDNPDKGVFHHWPTVGDLILKPPSHYEPGAWRCVAAVAVAG